MLVRLAARSVAVDVLQDHIDHPARYLLPILIGFMIDLMLFGVLASETIRYCRWFRDSSKFKMIVAALFITNVAQTTIVFYTVVDMLALGFGDWEGTMTNLYFEAILITEAFCVALSQGFFLERAYTLSVRRTVFSYALLIFAVPAILAGFALGVSSAAVTIIQATSSTDFASFRILVFLITSWKSVGLLTDVVITSTIIHGLLTRRSNWSATNSLIARLVRWILQAQCLPLAASLMFLVSYAYDPAANVCLVASMAEGKLCAISVIHVLNSRRHLRHDDSTTEKAGEGDGPSGGRGSKSRGFGAGADGFEGESMPSARKRVYVQTLTVTKRSDADEGMRDFDLESYRTGQLRNWSPTPSHPSSPTPSHPNHPSHSHSTTDHSSPALPSSAPPSPPPTHILPYETTSELYRPPPQPKRSQSRSQPSRSHSPFGFASSPRGSSSLPRPPQPPSLMHPHLHPSPYLTNPLPGAAGPVPMRRSSSSDDDGAEDEVDEAGLPSQKSLEAAMARGGARHTEQGAGGGGGGGSSHVKAFEEMIW